MVKVTWSFPSTPIFKQAAILQQSLQKINNQQPIKSMCLIFVMHSNIGRESKISAQPVVQEHGLVLSFFFKEEDKVRGESLFLDYLTSCSTNESFHLI